MGMSPTETQPLSTLSRLATVAANDTTFAERMDAAGLGEDVLVRKLKEKLNALETKYFADKGVVTDQRSVKAHDIQLRTLAMLLKMRGLLTDRNTVVNVGGAGIVQFSESGPPAWQPSSVRQQLTDTAPIPAVHNDSDSVPSHLSTLVGPLGRPGGLGHTRQNARWKAKCSPNGKVARGVRKMQRASAKVRCKPTHPSRRKPPVHTVPVKRGRPKRK